jgi:GTPase
VSGFVDEAQVHVKAGDGGAGAISFRREAHVARGGPDGGDGGNGGDVWLVARANAASLLAFRDQPYRRAGDGGHGSGQRRRGREGRDLEVPVPEGTVVHGPDGEVLGDLGAEGDRWLAAEGGRGGWGNARFLSNRRRAPKFAEQGERGEERWLDLELKLSADVALVGFPNAGKSTLIAAVSAARPKIAPYPFTTLAPHLGVVRVGGRPARQRQDDVELVMADVPGLVEGAADGRGLGHRFLRHVERARVLLVLLDLASVDERSPGEQLRILLDELGRYHPELLDRPRLVVGSKIDLAEPVPEPVAGPRERGGADGVDLAEPAAAQVGPRGRSRTGRVDDLDLSVSAVTGQGIAELLARLARLVTGARAAAPRPERTETVVHRPVPDDVVVTRIGDGRWQVSGRRATRAVRFSDLTDDGALEEAVRRLRRLGVDKSLARAGVREGDEVQVGELSFTWSGGEEGGATSTGTTLGAKS